MGPEIVPVPKRSPGNIGQPVTLKIKKGRKQIKERQKKKWVDRQTDGQIDIWTDKKSRKQKTNSRDEVCRQTVIEVIT